VDDWDKMLALNLSAPMRLTHAFSPGMVRAQCFAKCAFTCQ
jgi:short-subunit dehydrogenase